MTRKQSYSLRDSVEIFYLSCNIRGKWGKEIQRGKETQRYINLYNQKTGNQSIYKPYRLTSGLDDSIDMLGQKMFCFLF